MCFREGASPVGRKIGFTNRDMWRVYGVHEPIWAFVYDTTVMYLPNSHGTCSLRRFTEPRIEPEIVLHFRSAPPVSSDPRKLLPCKAQSAIVSAAWNFQPGKWD